MDLLVKWLCPDPSRYSQNICAENVMNPSLSRIWERLGERYGRPEMVESSIKSKLQTNLKIGNRDHDCLYELPAVINSD